MLAGKTILVATALGIGTMSFIQGADSPDTTESVLSVFREDRFQRLVTENHIFMHRQDVGFFDHSATMYSLVRLYAEGSLKDSPLLAQLLEGYKQIYKIHLTIEPQYMQKILTILQEDMSSSTDYAARVATFKVIKRLKDITYSPRTQFSENAAVVFYPYNENAAQWLYDRLGRLYEKHEEMACKYPLRHNIGGPLVWWAGGDGDLKPGGIHDESDNEAYRNFFEEQPAGSGMYPIVKGQKMLVDKTRHCLTKIINKILK